MKTSSFLSLKWKDAIKGFIVAILTVILTGISTGISTGELPTMGKIQSLLLMGLGAGIAYIVKNWLTNSDDQFLKKEQ